MTSMIVINAVLWSAASAVLGAFMYAPVRLLDDRPTRVAREYELEYREAA
jgi:hypothetical protein